TYSQIVSTYAYENVAACGIDNNNKYEKEKIKQNKTTNVGKRKKP
ncbi:hypothetical protein DOY81_008668, partial [Sarcophaga bullata]